MAPSIKRRSAPATATEQETNVADEDNTETNDANTGDTANATDTTTDTTTDAGDTQTDTSTDAPAPGDADTDATETNANETTAADEKAEVSADGETQISDTTTERTSARMRRYGLNMAAKPDIYAPAPDDKPSTELSVEDLTLRLFASGILLSTEKAEGNIGRGFKVASIGDEARGVMSTNNLSSEEDIVSWAHHEAIRLFPSSEYTLTYGRLAPKDDTTSATS